MKALLLMAALLSSCTREAWQATPLSPAADSVLRADLPSARKVKFTAPVTITLQQGNHNVATPTATGKVKAAAVATGVGNAATSQSKATPWWVLGLCVVGGGLVGAWLRGRLALLPFGR